MTVDEPRYCLPPTFHRGDPAGELLWRAWNLPPDLRQLYSEMNGGEGFIGEAYVRIYPVDQIEHLNHQFGVSEFAPGVTIFGSNGGGEAYAFRSHPSGVTYLQLPFIPLRVTLAHELARTLHDALNVLAGALSSEESPAPDPDLIGVEVHEVHPVVFGGDPLDPKNKALLQVEEYAKYVVWWNRRYRDLEGA